MPLHRDLNGDLVPFGKVTRTRNADFLDGTMPSWLEASSGTASFATPDTSWGYAQVATAATTDATATLQTTAQFDARHFRAISWTVEGFHMSHDSNLFVFMSIGDAADATRGAKVYQTGASTPVLQGVGSGTVQASVPYQIRAQGEGLLRRNMTLLWRPQDYEAYLMTGDQVISHVSGTQLHPLGLCRAYLSITTKEAVAKNFRLSQARLEFQHN